MRNIVPSVRYTTCGAITYPISDVLSDKPVKQTPAKQNNTPTLNLSNKVK